MSFPDVWVSPGSIIDLAQGGSCEAWDFRELTVGQLVSVNSVLLSPERLGAVVKECMGLEGLPCGSSPIMLSRYRVELI